MAPCVRSCARRSQLCRPDPRATSVGHHWRLYSKRGAEPNDNLGGVAMAAGSGEHSWRILIVDDEENLNWSLVNSLRMEGYTADGVTTGTDAQQRLRSTRYDCVVSDVMMPGMDGFELLQWIRRNQPATRVIMMTAFGSPTSRQEALKGGVVAYLEKPFDLHVLKEEVAKMAGAGSASAPLGRADEYDLLEVAQVLNLSRRDIALSLKSGEQAGRIRFLRGEPVW